MRVLAVVVAVGLIVVAARAATAAEGGDPVPYDAPLPAPAAVPPVALPAPPPPPAIDTESARAPTPPRPSAAGLATGQILVASLAVFLGEAAMLAAAGQVGNGELVIPALALGPTMGGLVVCAVGTGSTTYTGRCGPAILGAYLGALTAIPATFVGCALDSSHDNDSEFGCLGGAVLGFVAGYVFGTATGATIGWHATKRLRDVPPAPGPIALDTFPELRRRPGPPGSEGGARVSVPLLSLRF